MSVYHKLEGMVELHSGLAYTASVIFEVNGGGVTDFSKTVIDLMLSGF